MGYFSPLPSLSILYYLCLPPWLPILPDLGGWMPRFFPNSCSWVLMLFFSYMPFSNPCRSQLPFAKLQLLRDNFGCPTKSWCSLWCSLGIFSPCFIFSLVSAGVPAAAVAFPALQGVASLTWASPKCIGSLAAGCCGAHLYCRSLLVAAACTQ